MAPQKQVVEVPRFLLPRLTWNTSPRTAVAPPEVAAIPTRRPSTFGSKLAAQKVQNSWISVPSSTSLISSRSYSTAHTVTRRPSITNTASTSSAEPVGNPIKYNGVYVAAFKPARRAFRATAVQQRDHHFDTLKFVQRLKKEGFSEDQAVAMMRVLNDVIEESIQNLTRTMVLREDSERSIYTQKVDFAKLRSELLNADSTEAQLTRSSHERISADLAKLNSRLRDEIGRTQASVRLDLNLEKGRIREEANGQEMRIKETETRIEQEVAGVFALVPLH
ncbi:Protein fmp32, mitochondrial [Paecilomyces lecythidis]|uniref:Protein fmp32, mitochondrial n=1 Tax=Paecilomyces lecythidis TaxID=3004212 RepID=A0ABR3XZI3_9EURO